MSKLTDQDLAALLTDAQRGNRKALNTLCREIEYIMRGYFWNKFQDTNLVDDLSQETYVRLLQAMPGIREPMKLRGFVAKVALHVSQDYLRQKYRIPEVELQPAAEIDDDSFPQKEKGVAEPEFGTQIFNSIDLQNAMSKLPAQTRQILFMKADGYKYDEIAAELGLSVSGVKMTIQRSMEKLRSVLLFVTFFCIVATLLTEILG